MTEWQPIETAPKDGSSILIVYICPLDGPLVKEAQWWKRWYTDETNQGWMLANLDEEYGDYIEPTHWMPLPEPPVSP